MKKLNILVSNDDGVNAPGINALAEMLQEFGHVTVVAPDSARSGASAQITTTLPLRLIKMAERENFLRYRCTGTPADCVKVALSTIFAEKKPDLIITGINHGRNDGICVIYSGTVGAALEGCIGGVPSLAVSISGHGEDTDLTYAVEYARSVVKWMSINQIPLHTMLNLNVPKGKPLGLRIAPQAVGKFTNEIVTSTNGAGQPVHWLSGSQEKTEEKPDTDLDFLEQGYATLTPLRLDMTDYSFLDSLQRLPESDFC